MKQVAAIPEEKKLVLTYRVEPGCLGPDGKKHIEDFCLYAAERIPERNLDYIRWQIIPRFDKSLPELEYRVMSRSINYTQAKKYLSLFAMSLDDLEMNISDSLSVLIDSYLRP